MTFEPVADGVLVRTSRRASTTTTLVLGPPDRDGVRPGLLVDPAWEADELEAIADEIDALGVRVVAGLATHAHHDHLLWHPRYGADVVRWASAGTVREVATRWDALVAELTADAAYPDEVLDTFAHVAAVPGDALPDPDGVLPETRVVVHDGHAPGHTALWLPGPRVLVVGDMLSDVEIPLPFDPDDLPAYLDGLDRLAPYAAHAEVLVPGHGSPSSQPGVWSPIERLDADRRYLDAVLTGHRVDDPRLADPGMLAEHEHVVRVASAQAREHGAGSRRGERDEDERRQALPERRPHD
jgi:glyoxylase-like metal-dependent hydrolase (beta-lactamase superfamily II)